MAQNILSVITLPSDAGSGFEPGGLSAYAGDKIYIYWDTSTNAFVVKLESNTRSVGTNEGAWGDSGDFETAESGWLGAETGKPETIAGNLVRSSAVAHAGTYSAKLTAPYSGYNPLIRQIIGSPIASRRYYVTCWVYVPSGAPIAASGDIILYAPPTSSGSVSNVIGTTVADATDTWVQISCVFSALFTNNTVVGIKLSGGTVLSGGTIHFDEFYIEKDNGFTSGSTTTLTAGAILPQLSPSNVDNNSGEFTGTKGWKSGYKYCSEDGSNTLNEFYGYLKASEFPYAGRDQSPNHFSCVNWESQISISVVSITQASSQFDEDGAFEVSGISNGGEIVYKISEEQPIYPDGQGSGVFSSLFPGVYKVWVIDEKQGAAFLNITLPYDISNTPQPTTPNSYSEKYRYEHSDLENGTTSRVSILERNFNGDYIEVTGGETPFLRELTTSEINDKFDPIRESKMTITLMSVREFQFIGLFSQDDRKFQVRQTKNSQEVWRGYLVPSVFSEPYTEYPPYETTVTATDGLILLEDEPFLDRDGNRYDGYMTIIKIVANILGRLDLELGIRIGVNISEDSHNGIKPFEETQYNVYGFYEDDGTPWTCTRVLRAILMPFGAKLVQEGGYWNIIRIEEQTDTYDVLIYDKDGVYDSSSTYNPILAISDPTLRMNSAFINADHILEVNPAYGKITINHTLFPKASILTSYSFEKIDEGGSLFKGWSISTSTGTIKATRAEITQGQSAIQFESLDNVSSLFATGNKYAILYSNPHPVEFSPADSFKFSFQYRINQSKKDRFGNTIDSSNLRSYYGPPYWTRIGWRISAGGNIFYNENIGWTSDSSFQWNYLWVKKDDYNKILDFKIDNFYVPEYWSSTVTSAITVSLWIEGGTTTDAQSQAELEAIATTTKPLGYKIKVYNSGSYYYYELVDATGLTASWPNIVEPDDFDGSTNNVYWNAETSVGGSQFPIDAVLIDNVIFNIYPNSEEIPETEELTIVNNENFKENLNVEIEGGDVTGDSINSKRYIYNAFFVDQNNDHTTTWARDAVQTEAASIQSILLKSLVNQYRYPSFRFSGSLVGFTDFGFLTTLKHTQTAPSLSLTNEEFTGNATGWSNSDTGTSWAYNSNDVQVALSGATDSKLFGQSLTGYAGQRISIEHSITRSASSGTRGDWLICAMTQGGSIVQEVVLEDNMISDSSLTNLRRFSFDNDFDAIHFYIRNIAGTGDATYNMDFFKLVPMTIVRYYTPNALTINDKENIYSGEWTQLIPVVPSSDPTIDDSGEGNTGSEGGSGSGSGSGGDYDSRDYDSRDYDI